MDFPDAMTPSQRAAVFDELAAMERAPKRPFGFGDFKMCKSDGTPVPCRNHRTNGGNDRCITCGETIHNKEDSTDD
jgi:hypothetical protein